MALTDKQWQSGVSADEPLHTPGEYPDLLDHRPAPVKSREERFRRWLKSRTDFGKTEIVLDTTINEALAKLSPVCHILAFGGAKGGGGKSSLSLIYASILAKYEHAHPILLEVNPDWAPMRDLLPDACPRTMVDLLREASTIQSKGLPALQHFCTPYNGVPVVLAPSDPNEMLRLPAVDLEAVIQTVSRFYNLVILDCGTSFVHPFAQLAIQSAHHVNLVMLPEYHVVRQTLRAAEYIASERYPADYRGELADTERVEMRRLALADVTLVMNRSGERGPDAVSADKVRNAMPGIHDLVSVPYSRRLAKLLADRTLTQDNMPAKVRAAAKRLIASNLNRMAESRPPA